MVPWRGADKVMLLLESGIVKQWTVISANVSYVRVVNGAGVRVPYSSTRIGFGTMSKVYEQLKVM